MKQLFFDFETTGVHNTVDVPIQIAGIVCEEFGSVISSFNERVFTKRPINPHASAVHGIYNKDLKDCRWESEVLKDFILWIKEHSPDMVSGYNIKSFDLIMLSTRCEYQNYVFPLEGVQVFDTRDLVLAGRKQNLLGLGALGRKWSLPATAEILGIAHTQAHDALADVMTTKAVYDKLRREINV